MKISRKEQLELIRIHDGKILSAIEIRTLFGYSETTSIVDMWLYALGYFEQIAKNEHDNRIALYKIVYNKQIKQT